MNLRHVLAAAVATAALSTVLAPVAYAADAPAKLPSCNDVSMGDGGYEMKLLKAELSAIAGPVVVGGDWYPFTGTLTSTAAGELKDVSPRVLVFHQSDLPDEQVGPYMNVEYRSKETGRWVALTGGGGSLGTLGTLKPQESVTYELRLRARKDLPALIKYADADFSVAVDDVYTSPRTGRRTPCRADVGAMDGFEIKQAGPAKPTDKPDPKPTVTPTVTASATATASGGPKEPGTPTGTASATAGSTSGSTPSSIPGSTPGSPSGSTPSSTPTAQLAGTTTGATASGTGDLASTGASGALPKVGLIGGAAVLVGVAAVVAVRRRSRS